MVGDMFPAISSPDCEVSVGLGLSVGVRIGVGLDEASSVGSGRSVGTIIVGAIVPDGVASPKT